MTWVLRAAPFGLPYLALAVAAALGSGTWTVVALVLVVASEALLRARLPKVHRALEAFQVGTSTRLLVRAALLVLLTVTAGSAPAWLFGTTLVAAAALQAGRAVVVAQLRQLRARSVWPLRCGGSPSPRWTRRRSSRWPPGSAPPGRTWSTGWTSCSPQASRWSSPAGPPAGWSRPWWWRRVSCSPWPSRSAGGGGHCRPGPGTTSSPGSARRWRRSGPGSSPTSVARRRAPTPSTSGSRPWRAWTCRCWSWSARRCTWSSCTATGCRWSGRRAPPTSRRWWSRRSGWRSTRRTSRRTTT